MEKEKFSLKDHLFNAHKLNKIAQEIHAVYPKFEKEKFVNSILNQFPNLELKERIVCISVHLSHYLPPKFEDAVEVILNALPEPCNPNLQDNDFGDFIYASYGEFVANFGCNENHLELSLNALEQITQRFSMEYAIRPFINSFPEQTFAKMYVWCEHEHYHVRRLASEGSRPKLPWGKKINSSIEATMPLLDLLHSDSTRFVTRSVANHLNDISKTNPELVLSTLKKWQKSKKQNSAELEFITKHALRTLVKAGNQKALEHLGFAGLPKLQINVLCFSKQVKMNDFFHFEIALNSNKSAQLMIDYIIHFQNSKGQMARRKVFKIKQLNVQAETSALIGKKHEMKQFMTTRQMYPGAHLFELQINGELVFSRSFELVI